MLAKLVYYAIMLFVLSTAFGVFGVFGTNPVSTYLHAVIAYLPLIFIAIIIVIISAAGAAGAKALIQNSLGGLSYAKVLANTASAVILTIGVIAALDQLHIAPNVVNAVLYAALAAIVGVIIVAVGGGGIMTMSARWEAVAARYDDEKPRITEAVRNAPSVADQARQGQQQVRQHAGDDPYGSGARRATAAPPADQQPGYRADPAGY